MMYCFIRLMSRLGQQPSLQAPKYSILYGSGVKVLLGLSDPSTGFDIDSPFGGNERK